MSELNSLFIRVKIKKNKLDDFFKSKPNKPKIDVNWTEWWNSRKMSEKIKLSEDNMSCYEQPNNQSIVESWVNDKRSGGFSEYNAENEIWNFGIVFFGNNYFEIIPGLVFIKSIAKYIEYNSNNFAIVFDFFWDGNEVSTYTDFKENKSYFKPEVKIKSDISSEKIKYAEAYLDKKVQEFSKTYED